MEQKLDKLFEIFEDIKLRNLFQIAVKQIAELYRNNPSCINYLLKKALKLVFSDCSDQSISLEHR